MKEIENKNEYLKRLKYYTELGQHKYNVAQLLMYFAYYLDLGEASIRTCYLTGMLHDIGKSIIDIDLLTKEDKLNFNEMEIMKNHVEFGYKNTAGYDDEVWKGVVEHHENYDGSGYPTSLQGQEISLIGRMIRICDMYEALTAPRAYKGPLSHREAIQIMYQDIRLLDKVLFEQFLDMIDTYNLDKLAEESYNNRAENIVQFYSNHINKDRRRRNVPQRYTS